MLHRVSHSGFVAHQRPDVISEGSNQRWWHWRVSLSCLLFPVFSRDNRGHIKLFLFSPLAVITSLLSRPFLFRLFSLLPGQTNRNCWRGGRKEKRSKPRNSCNLWCLEVNWFGKITRLYRNVLLTFSFRKIAGTIHLQFSKYLTIITITTMVMNLLGGTPVHGSDSYLSWDRELLLHFFCLFSLYFCLFPHLFHHPICWWQKEHILGVDKTIGHLSIEDNPELREVCWSRSWNHKELSNQENNYARLRRCECKKDTSSSSFRCILFNKKNTRKWLISELCDKCYIEDMWMPWSTEQEVLNMPENPRNGP